MTVHRMWRLLALVAVLLLVAAACGDDDDDDAGGDDGSGTTAASETTAGGTETSAGGGGAGAGVNVGMALPGPQNDRGFNEAHFRGITLAADELGITANVQDNVTDPQARIDALRNLAADNQLVIGVGAEFADAGLVVAPQFPDVTFMVINGQTDPEAPNLYVYGVRQGVPAYVAGVIAASLPDVTSFGYIGGEEIPPTTQSDDGFRAGVESVLADADYASTIVGDFNDVQGGKEATAAQLAEGAQAIFSFLDAGFPGSVQAAEEAGGEAYLFNPIFPRCEEYENLVGTAYLNSDRLVVSMVADFLEDTIPAESLFYGIEDPDIQRFELCPAFAADAALVQLVEDTSAGINDGSITLPDGV